MFITFDGHSCGGKSTHSQHIKNTLDNSVLWSFYDLARNNEQGNTDYNKYDFIVVDQYVPSWMMETHYLVWDFCVNNNAENIVKEVSKGFSLPFVNDRTHIHFFMDLSFEKYEERKLERDNDSLSKYTDNEKYLHYKKLFENRRRFFHQLIETDYLIPIAQDDTILNIHHQIKKHISEVINEKI